MSYDVTLGKKGPVKVTNHSEGGTYALGGIETAELNITYNYSKHYRIYLDDAEGLRWLHDRKAKDTMQRLQGAINSLGTKQSEDYWESTPGNAGYALSILLLWAKQHPNAKWIVE